MMSNMFEEDRESDQTLSDPGSEDSDNLSEVETDTLDEDSSSSSDEEEISTLSTHTDAQRKSKIIVTEPSGVRGNGVGVTDYNQALSLFICNKIVDKVVKHTNEYIESKTSSYSRSRDCRPTDSVEIRALLGLLYIGGSIGTSDCTLDNVYANDGTGVPIFHSTMPQKRMMFLLNSLRFDDETKRKSLRADDKAATIREVFSMFTENCRSAYSVGENVVIDTMMIGFEGKCPFKQHMKSKTIKHGIKLYPLVSKSSYVLNIELDTYKKQEGPKNSSEAANDVVKKLIAPISGTGRTLIINNMYTSISLVEDLSENHSIYAVSALRKIQNMDQNSDLRNKRCVTLISSLDFKADAAENRHERQNKSMVDFYNKNKDSVEKLDKLIKKYIVSRKNKRWPLTLFFRLLDIAGINAAVILLSNGVDIKRTYRFLRVLGVQLTKEHVQRRAAMENLPRRLKSSIRKILNLRHEEPSNDEGAPTTTSRGSCKICPAKRRRQSKTQCTSCRRNICREHTAFICNKCYSDHDSGTGED